jgi:nitrate/TMAO reductase-like tetraheme cytochrome c subunit
MNQEQTPKKKRFPLIPVIAIGAVVLVVLVAGGFAFAASQESHDAFCASCHTMPESTFVDRSTAAAPVDLASFHTAKNTACIDCHSGQGIFGRIQAELVGAKNAFKWYTGTAVQPAVLTTPVGDANCLKCHAQVTAQNFLPQEQISVAGAGGSGGGRGGGESGRANHWHVQLSKWQATSSTAGSCVSCHSGHDATSTSSAGFMNSQNVQDTCNACHQVLRREGGG